MTRWRLDIAYDGTDFRGWATQPGHRTVQEVLEFHITRVISPWRMLTPFRLSASRRESAVKLNPSLVAP